MNDFIKLMDSYIGKFVCTDGGIYRGQCPQLIKEIIQIMGCDWVGKTGNGNQVLDIMCNNYGGYWGKPAYDYRLGSANNKYDSNGHCWIELKINGKWYRYEQNVNNDGAKTADYGCGKVYSITKTDKDLPTYLYDVKYAGHPSIDYYIQVHNKKEDDNKNQYPDYFKKFTEELGNYIANYCKKG